MAILHLAHELNVVIGVNLMDKYDNLANLCCVGLNPSNYANGKILHTIVPTTDDHKIGIIIRVFFPKSYNNIGKEMSTKEKSTS